MLYERSLRIEERLKKVLCLISEGRHSTPEIADALGVSVPTISRDVTALRQRGNAIRAERSGPVWRYVLEREAPEKRIRKPR